MNRKNLAHDLAPVGTLTFVDVWNKTPSDAIYLAVPGGVFSGYWWATPGRASDLVDRYVAELLEET